MKTCKSFLHSLFVRFRGIKGWRWAPVVRSESGSGGAFQYSRRVLRLWRRGAYSPVLTHGLRVASLRSGGCRLAVRETIECHLCAQLRTPFCHYVAFPLKGKQGIVPLPPAPLEMVRAQSTEPCAPLRGRGPRSGAGVLYGKSLK